MQYTVFGTVLYRRQHVQVSFLVCLVLSFASGVLFACGTSSRRGKPNISESNGPGGTIILEDPSLRDKPTSVGFYIVLLHLYSLQFTLAVKTAESVYTL